MPKMLAVLVLLLAAPLAAQDAQITEAGAVIAARPSEAQWASIGDDYPEVRGALVARWNALAVAEAVEGQPVPARVKRNFQRNLLTLERAILKRIAELKIGT